MDINEQKQVQKILQTQAKLKKISAQKAKLSLKLASTNRLLEELENTKEETVTHIIDNILIPRDTRSVKDEMKNNIEFISSQLKSLKEGWDIELAKFKQMNAIPDSGNQYFSSDPLNRMKSL
jgi:chaperonin cofactor prefoldin